MPTPSRPTLRQTFCAALALCLWLAAYSCLLPLAEWLTFGLLGLDRGSPFGPALAFFLYDTPKILLLLILMVYAIGWLRAGLDTDRVRDFLKGKQRLTGYLIGATFGAVTPFCSCSSIPLFIGFTTARIPLGMTMAFLITSPIINEVAVVLLWGLLGWKFTLVYVATGMVAGTLGGLLIDTLRAERWLHPSLLEEMARPPFRTLTMASMRKGPTVMQRHAFALGETRKIFLRVWRWVIVGVAIGALLHGFVPQEWFTEHMGAGQWWTVPLSVSLGIPLYTNVTGIIPVMESLLAKGLPAGTTLAFCMSTVAASLPEMIMLRQVMQPRLLAIFVGFLLVMFTLTGWLFNALPAFSA